MNRHHITLGASTTTGGKVITASSTMSINGATMALEGDSVFCVVCKSIGTIKCVEPRQPESFAGRAVALHGDICVCKCRVPPLLVANQTSRYQTMEEASVRKAAQAEAKACGAGPSRELASKICAAICDCNTMFNTAVPSKLEMAEAAESAIDTIRGVEDKTAEPASASKKIHRRQACFAGHFADGPTWYGAKPKDPAVLVEVPFKIPTQALLSETGRTTYRGGPIAPMSPLRAVSQARGDPGTTVIWDMATLKDPKLSATWDNVDKIIEIKFAGDTPTRNQKKAAEDGEVRQKLLIINEEDCGCELEEQERRRKENEVIQKIGEGMQKLAPLVSLD
jgi:uncharacterized Zn-binding protein involved in type VI secretion